ncbi:MAG: Ig-like domain-containing protein, partial [Haloferula sp.]
GHYFFGEITLGGVRRASFEKVNGKWQGCAYRFSQGFEGGVNRLAWAPDGSLYIGCIGASSNWSWNGTTFGLQRLKPKSDGTVAFEIKEVRAEEDGFSVEYTKPIDTAFASEPGNFTVKQWTYTPTAEYGGVKQDQSTLSVSESALSPDGRTVRLVVPGLKEGYVHHLSADLPSAAGETLWSAEAWYTLNAIPGDPSGNPVGELAFDDFSTYAEGVAVNGQDGGGTLTGFGATSWTANGAVQVNGGAFNQGANSLRSSRSFSATPLAASGTIYVRANLALSNADSGVNFSALELATTLNSDADAVRLIGSSAGLSVGVTGTGGAGSGSLLANDGANHEWLMEIDLSTKAGQVWIDPDIEGFDPAVGGTAFTVSSGFALNGINVATFGGSSSVVLDGFRIGGTLADVGVGAGDSPTLSFIAPIDDAGNVPVAVTPVATFSKPVALTGSGSIMLKNLSGGTDIPVALPGDVDIIGAVLTITPGSPLVAGEEYAVEITSNALEDLSVPAAPYAGILATDVPNWSFTTDGTSPGVDLLSPMAGAAEVSPNADLSLSFDEPVVVGTGHVTVHLAEGTLVETIDVTSGAVTITGNSVSIDVGDLALSTAYYVNIDVGAFIDLAGNGFGGITDTTTWSFTTWAAPTLPLA